MAEKDVPLSRSYPSRDGPFSRVTLRAPTYNEIFMSGIGEPQEWQPVPGGRAYVTYPERVDAYLQRIVVAPSYEYLSPLEAGDALLLKEAVCGFFMVAAAPSNSQTSSSSGSAGQPTSSDE